MELRGHDGEGLVGAQRRAADDSAPTRPQGVPGLASTRPGEPALGSDGTATRAVVLVEALCRQIAPGVPGPQGAHHLQDAVRHTVAAGGDGR